MCGIAGGMWHAAHRPADLQGALVSLRHRGPDDEGVWHKDGHEAEVTLAQTRLSIIDLSHGGHQPMVSQDGSLTLVFNGEIYNYLELRQELKQEGIRFTTASDTEVLLAAWQRWGTDCLPRLRGMFAFAVYSAGDESLTLVRDPWGIKPLYAAWDADHLVFASELPALRTLLSGRPAVNEETLYRFLAYGTYDQATETFWRGVSHLPPGHVMRVVPHHGRLTVSSSRWWWPDVSEVRDTLEEATDRVRELFLQSVRLHLRSDVPIGTALSGGIDSTAIVAAIRHLEPEADLHTFSFVPHGYPRGEATWIDLVNQQLSTRPNRIDIDERSLMQDIDDLIRTQGEPFGSTSIYAQYAVYRRVRERGVIVTLDGQGADELLAGYDGYPTSRLRSLLGEAQLLRAAQLTSNWARWPGRSTQVLARRMLRESLPDGVSRWLDPRSRPRAVPAWAARDQLAAFSRGGGNRRRDRVRPSGRRALAEMLRYELSAGSLSPLLRHGDRNSMRWSVESRVPFLDVDLVEYVLRLPSHYLLSDTGESKHIFRRAMRGIVPDEVLDRRDKIGFATPETAWIRAAKRETNEWLGGLDLLPLVDPQRSRRLILDMQSGVRPYDPLCWRLLNAARWAQLSLG